MLTSILTIIGAAGTIAAGIMAYKNSANRQRRNAEKDVEMKEEEMNAKKDEIRTAVHTQNDTKVNNIVSDLLTPILVICLLFGCASKTQIKYVPCDRQIVSCTNSNGVACKIVPDVVFCELLEKAQELKDLKKEMAVDKRLQK